MEVGPWRAGPANNLNPPLTRRVFLEEEFVDLDEHRLAQWLRIVCAECGDDLILSPSGHQLCANRICREGFDVRVVPQFAARPCD
jgi:hypothetical protein